MRWKREAPAAPEHNEIRERRVFAWKPKEVGNEVVWLESYGVRERFFQPASGNPGWWSVVSEYTLVHYY